MGEVNNEKIHKIALVSNDPADFNYHPAYDPDKHHFLAMGIDTEFSMGMLQTKHAAVKLLRHMASQAAFYPGDTVFKKNGLHEVPLKPSFRHSVDDPNDQDFWVWKTNVLQELDIRQSEDIDRIMYTLFQAWMQCRKTDADMSIFWWLSLAQSLTPLFVLQSKQKINGALSALKCLKRYDDSMYNLAWFLIKSAPMVHPNFTAMSDKEFREVWKTYFKMEGRAPSLTSQKSLLDEEGLPKTWGAHLAQKKDNAVVELECKRALLVMCGTAPNVKQVMGVPTWVMDHWSGNEDPVYKLKNGSEMPLGCLMNGENYITDSSHELQSKYSRWRYDPRAPEDNGANRAMSRLVVAFDEFDATTMSRHGQNGVEKAMYEEAPYVLPDGTVRDHATFEDLQTAVDQDASIEDIMNLMDTTQSYRLHIMKISATPGASEHLKVSGKKMGVRPIVIKNAEQYVPLDGILAEGWVRDVPMQMELASVSASDKDVTAGDRKAAWMLKEFANDQTKLNHYFDESLKIKATFTGESKIEEGLFWDGVEGGKRSLQLVRYTDATKTAQLSFRDQGAWKQAGMPYIYKHEWMARMQKDIHDVEEARKKLKVETDYDRYRVPLRQMIEYAKNTLDTDELNFHQNLLCRVPTTHMNARSVELARTMLTKMPMEMISGLIVSNIFGEGHVMQWAIPKSDRNGFGGPQVDPGTVIKALLMQEHREIKKAVYKNDTQQAEEANIVEALRSGDLKEIKKAKMHGPHTNIPKKQLTEEESKKHQHGSVRQLYSDVFKETATYGTKCQNMVDYRAVVDKTKDTEDFGIRKIELVDRDIYMLVHKCALQTEHLSFVSSVFDLHNQSHARFPSIIKHLKFFHLTFGDLSMMNRGACFKDKTHGHHVTGTYFPMDVKDGYQVKLSYLDWLQLFGRGCMTLVDMPEHLKAHFESTLDYYDHHRVVRYISEPDNERVMLYLNAANEVVTVLELMRGQGMSWDEAWAAYVIPDQTGRFDHIKDVKSRSTHTFWNRKERIKEARYTSTGGRQQLEDQQRGKLKGMAEDSGAPMRSDMLPVLAVSLDEATRRSVTEFACLEDERRAETLSKCIQKEVERIKAQNKYTDQMKLALKRGGLGGEGPVRQRAEKKRPADTETDGEQSKKAKVKKMSKADWLKLIDAAFPQVRYLCDAFKNMLVDDSRVNVNTEKQLNTRLLELLRALAFVVQHWQKIGRDIQADFDGKVQNLGVALVHATAFAANVDPNELAPMAQKEFHILKAINDGNAARARNEKGNAGAAGLLNTLKWWQESEDMLRAEGKAIQRLGKMAAPMQDDSEDEDESEGEDEGYWSVGSECEDDAGSSVATKAAASSSKITDSDEDDMYD